MNELVRSSIVGEGRIIGYGTPMCGLGNRRKANKLNDMDDKVGARLHWQTWAWSVIFDLGILFAFHLLCKITSSKFASSSKV